MKLDRQNALLKLQNARGRLKAWRKKGRPGHKIPEEIWQAAVELYPTLSINEIRNALGLNHTALSRRLKPESNKSSVEKAGFIELDNSLLFTKPAVAPDSTRVEFRDALGNTMIMHLTQLGAAELQALVAGFRGQR